MFKKKKYPLVLISSIVLIIFTLLYVIFLSPNQKFMLLELSVSSIIIFFALIFSSISLLMTFIFRNYKRGLLAGGFIVVVLLLRLIGFTSLIYPILLLAFIILVDRLLRN